MKLRMTGRQYSTLAEHLFPGDGLESVAILLCGRRHDVHEHILAVQHCEFIEHDLCQRGRDSVKWTTVGLTGLLDEAARAGLAVVKVHSHPGGSDKFSLTDDKSDREFFESVFTWADSDAMHASVIMVADGSMFGRSITADLRFESLGLISVAGDDLHFFPGNYSLFTRALSFARRHEQAFGSRTTNVMSALSIAVVGCSGTGSIVIEQLARLGVKRLVLIDPDIVEEKNLNRIVGATRADIGQPKAEVLANAVRKMGLSTSVTSVVQNLFSERAVLAVAGCDIALGCMDSAEGRHLLNRLCAFYSLPYFDVGVRLEADGEGGIQAICGSVNYLQPDGSSLLSRGIITSDAIGAEGMKRTNPERYEFARKMNYIAGVEEVRPAVISVNMHYASLVVLELLARLHPYRDDGNENFAWHGSSLTAQSLFNFREDSPCSTTACHVGRGDVVPLLDMPSLDSVAD